jgi:kynurenine formamidase/ketosteroid isomerase-like protein
MRLTTLAASLLVVALATESQAQTPQAPPPEHPSVALPPELDRVLRDYEDAWRRGDAAALAALFAEDGFILQGGRAPVRGRSAIQAAYTGQGGGPLRLRALAAATADSVGYIIGAYGYGDAPGDQGKFTLTLRQGPDGRWLIFSDMDNANRAPRPAGAAPAAAGAQQIDLTASRLVDLTHPFNAQTIYWPTSPSTFELQELAFGHTEGGYFYSAHAFCSPEHGGTHLDAPIHFAEGRQTTEQIPLERLVAPAVVIDVSASAARDPDYRLTPGDVLAFEQVHGRIPAGSIVLLRTGWSRHWPDRLRYLGDDTPGDASRLHFPSYGADAARLLVEERNVAVLGADVASIDYGQSRDFMVHRIAAAHNVPGLENLTNLDRLPPTGAVVVALPMKIEGGSGGPLRAVAIVPNPQ